MKTAGGRAGEPRANGTGLLGTRLIVNDVELRVPGWVTDIESFRRWTDTDEFPDGGNVWWLCGEVWADMSSEQIFTHIDLKGAIFASLFMLVRQARSGRMLTDGVLLSNFAADISGKPDGMFLSRETLASDRIRLIEGARGGYTELQGSPDMVLEVISDSSVKKDLVVLLEAYWKAGVTEYWVVDGREDPPRFDIYRHGPKGYKRVPKKHGWVASGVFGKAFRLTAGQDEAGHPEFTLEAR